LQAIRPFDLAKAAIPALRDEEFARHAANPKVRLESARRRGIQAFSHWMPPVGSGRQDRCALT